MTKIIWYTTGVFDLFHIWHLNILRNAKSMCDELIVWVTTDELVKERKNKNPIIPLSERMEIVENIKFVDRVVVQDTMDKFEAYNRYHFNRMFVWSDWKWTEKWNNLEIEFKKLWVEIVFFPYTETTSSTIIRELINKEIKW